VGGNTLAAGTLGTAGSVVNDSTNEQPTVLNSATLVSGSTVLATGSSFAASSVTAAGTMVI
jgi:hypothetical protein